MKKGYVNWKLVVVLLLGVAAVGATVVGVRKFNRTQRAEQGLKKGLAAYDEKRWKEATSNLGQYLAVHQTDVDILIKYGYAHSHIQPFRSDNFASAVNAYRAALRFAPDNRDAVLALAELYLQGQAAGEAESTTLRYLEKQFDGRIAQRLATAQILQRKFEQAATLLLDLVQREPKDAAIYELLARIAMERPDLTKKSPQEWLDTGVENNPDNAQAYLVRGNHYLRNGQRKQALQDIEKASMCEAPDIEVQLAIAASFLRLEASDKAQQQLDAVFGRSPDSVELWQLRAMLAAQRNNPDEAIRIAKEGIEQLGVNDIVFLPYAVELYLMADDVSSARAAMDKLRKADMDRGLTSYLDGLLAQRDGDWPQAMAHWREAMVQGYMAESLYLKLAEGAVQLEDRASAAETLRRYIDRTPQSFAAHLMLAHILADGRQWKDASEYAAAAVRLDPANPDAQQLQARCRIELLAAQPQSRGRVDQMLTELLASDDTLQNRLLVFRIMMSRQDWAKADSLLTELKARFGDAMAVQIAEAEYWTRKGQPKQAADILDQAMQRFPESSEPMILRAVLLADEDNADAALSLLTKASAGLDYVEQRKVKLWMCGLYHRIGRSEEAIQLLSKMAAENPQDIAVRRQLLAVGRQASNVKELQKWVDQIKGIEGPTGRLWKIEQVSLWLMDEGFSKRYIEAAELLNDNLKANPDDKQSLILLAAAHEQVGNLRLSVSLYREALTRHPDDIDLAIATMGALYRAEEYRQADQLLNELMAAGHTDPRLAQLELESHLRQGRLDTAEEMLEKMVARNAHDNTAKLSLAMLKTRNGQYEESRELIDELIAESPASIAVQAALADWYLKQGRQEEAVKACDEYLAAHEGVDAFRLRAQVLLTLGRKDLAVEDIQRISALAGNDLQALLSVSELYRLAGFQEKALEAARQALAADSQSFDAQKQAAMLLLDSPRTQQEGMQLLDQALSQQPRDVQLRLRKAIMLLSEGSTAASLEGLSLLNAVVSEYPRMESAWMFLGEWYLSNNQAGMAMDMALRGLASLPDSRSLLLLKARIEAMRSPSIAMETLAPLVRRYPDDARIAEMWAVLLHETGKTEQAVSVLQQWLAAAQTQGIETSSVSMRLMELLYQNGQAEQAGDLYKTLQSQPDNAMPAMLRWIGLIVKTAAADQIVGVFEQWYNAYPQGGGLAALSAAQGLMRETSPQALPAAERILTLVYNREPNSAEAAYGLAMFKHMNGQKLEAIPLYERTLEIRGDNVLAINNLAWILSQEKGEHARALELAEKGLAIAPDYTDLMDTRAAILYSLQRYEEAGKEFKRAADRYRENQPEKSASTFRLAQCLDKEGKKDAALVEYFRARDLDQKNGGLSEQQKTELAERLK